MAEGLDSFALRSSTRRPVVMMREDAHGRREVTGTFCCGVRMSSEKCLKCGEKMEWEESDKYGSSAVMCRDTYVDAVCCRIPIIAEKRSCSKCGKFFPSALELAEQATVLSEYRTSLHIQLSKINAEFFKFMRSYLKSEDYSYVEYMDCCTAFDKCNHSYKGFPAREAFRDNIMRTAIVLLNHGMAGLSKNPKSYFPEFDLQRHERYFL